MERVGGSIARFITSNVRMMRPGTRAGGNCNNTSKRSFDHLAQSLIFHLNSKKASQQLLSLVMQRVELACEILFRKGGGCLMSSFLAAEKTRAACFLPRPWIRSDLHVQLHANSDQRNEDDRTSGALNNGLSGDGRGFGPPKVR